MRPTRARTLMDTAQVWARRSTCSRNSVGVIVELGGRVISTGYNGAPAGMPHCSHECNCPLVSATGKRIIRVNNATPSEHEKDCPAESACTISVHAETNAIAYAARHGVALKQSTLYTTLQPCYVCAQLVINAGLRCVVFDRTYRDPAGLRLLMQAKIQVVRFTDNQWAEVNP